MVVALVFAIFVIYCLFVILALTFAPDLVGPAVDRNVYVFLLKMTFLWAGLTWIAVGVYISLVSQTEGYQTLCWLMFITGSTMSYLGIGVEVSTTEFWIGVRTLLFVQLSIVPHVILSNLVELGEVDRPSTRMCEVFHEIYGKYVEPCKPF